MEDLAICKCKKKMYMNLILSFIRFTTKQQYP